MEYIILVAIAVTSYTVLEIVKQIIGYLREGRDQKSRVSNPPNK